MSMERRFCFHSLFVIYPMDRWLYGKKMMVPTSHCENSYPQNCITYPEIIYALSIGLLYPMLDSFIMVYP